VTVGGHFGPVQVRDTSTRGLKTSGSAQKRCDAVNWGCTKTRWFFSLPHWGVNV